MKHKQQQNKIQIRSNKMTQGYNQDKDENEIKK